MSVDDARATIALEADPLLRPALEALTDADLEWLLSVGWRPCPSSYVDPALLERIMR